MLNGKSTRSEDMEDFDFNALMPMIQQYGPMLMGMLNGNAKAARDFDFAQLMPMIQQYGPMLMGMLNAPSKAARSESSEDTPKDDSGMPSLSDLTPVINKLMANLPEKSGRSEEMEDFDMSTVMPMIQQYGPMLMGMLNGKSTRSEDMEDFDFNSLMPMLQQYGPMLMGMITGNSKAARDFDFAQLMPMIQQYGPMLMGMITGNSKAARDFDFAQLMPLLNTLANTMKQTRSDDVLHHAVNAFHDTMDHEHFRRAVVEEDFSQVDMMSLATSFLNAFTKSRAERSPVDVDSMMNAFDGILSKTSAFFPDNELIQEAQSLYNGIKEYRQGTASPSSEDSTEEESDERARRAEDLVAQGIQMFTKLLKSTGLTRRSLTMEESTDILSSIQSLMSMLGPMMKQRRDADFAQMMSTIQSLANAITPLFRSSRDEVVQFDAADIQRLAEFGMSLLNYASPKNTRDSGDLQDLLNVGQALVQAIIPAVRGTRSVDDNTADIIERGMSFVNKFYAEQEYRTDLAETLNAVARLNGRDSFDFNGILNSITNMYNSLMGKKKEGRSTWDIQGMMDVFNEINNLNRFFEPLKKESVETAVSPASAEEVAEVKELMERRSEVNDFEFNMIIDNLKKFFGVRNEKTRRDTSMINLAMDMLKSLTSKQRRDGAEEDHYSHFIANTMVPMVERQRRSMASSDDFTEMIMENLLNKLVARRADRESDKEIDNWMVSLMSQLSGVAKRGDSNQKFLEDMFSTAAKKLVTRHSEIPYDDVVMNSWLPKVFEKVVERRDTLADDEQHTMYVFNLLQKIMNRRSVDMAQAA
eukprot:Nk52_evm35s242 gene=Nk52_evmTU35s242